MRKLESEKTDTSDNSIFKIFDILTIEELSYNSSDYVMYNLDIDSGEYIFMSPGISLLTGYTKIELNEIGFKSIVKEISSEKKDRYKINGNQDLNVEEFYAKYLIETKDGKFKWIEDNSFAYFDENGQRSQTTGVLRDTTALQIFVDRLNEEKSNLDKIFDLSDAMLLQVDKHLNIMLINQKGCRILGGSKKDIIGRNLEEFIPDNDKSNFIKYIEELINESGTVTRTTEGKIKSFDNKIKFIEWHNTLLRDKNGEIISIIASGQEITERRKEEKIRKIISEILVEANSEKNLDEIFKFIHQSISKLMKAENFYIAYYNREQNLLTFPYCVDEYDDDTSPKKLGKGLTEYVLRTGKSALVDKELDEKLVLRGETELVGEQSEIWLGVPLKIQNKVIGVMVVQDYEDPSTYGVTEQQILDVVGYPISRAIERKMVEADREELIVQLKELNESKDKLFSLISHDLRNPFNSLLGFADILTTEYDSLTKEEIKEYLNVINESSKNLYGMANNLLHYSRFQLGKYRYKPAFTNLSETVSNILSINNRIIKSKDLLFKNNIDNKLTAYFDEDIINIVLDNIIGNAIKFTPPGGTIKVEAKEGEQENTLKLIISDDGTGITNLNMQRIEKREMFSNPGTMREYGTGLGLSLSRDFMELNKGTLKIESEEGKGTTVTLTLPTTENLTVI
ncbi:MAG: PAS domain S-box protein [Bacteroidetes bacterium]|nr:PAS domain S-box protein [Bacteroidota bacterium]